MTTSAPVASGAGPRGSSADDHLTVPRTLADEHALLLAQVASRVGRVMAAREWPAAELRALASYLRAEVLRQAEDEEWLLFPARHTAQDFAQLARDHDRLRAGTEILEQAAAGAGSRSRAQVAAVSRDLLGHLKRHLAAEEQALVTADAPGQVPATTEPGSRQHGWYPLTEGSVIDLDAIPPGEVTDAVVDRIMRLRRGERLELRSSRDPEAVWQRIDQISPGRYGFAYQQDGPARWRVQVTRRPAAPQPAGAARASGLALRVGS
jgi:uncharacterized protein (DUF2249 family)